MNNQNKNNIGEEIKSTVHRALNTGDYKSLNRDIADIVSGALGEVKGSFNIKENNKYPPNRQNIDLYRKQNLSKARPRGKSKYMVPVGKTSGVLLTIFGSLGSFTFGIAVLVLTLLGYAIGAKAIFHTVAIGLSPLLILSIVSLSNGNKIRRRLARYQKYIGKMQNRDYFLVRELAAVTGQSDKSTAKDLQKMISLGMFPEGHVDEKGTYFILNNKAYEEYINVKEDLNLKKLEAEKEKPMLEKAAVTEKKSKLSEEARRTIDEGRDFVAQIKKANIAIPGEEISRRLDRLEAVTGKIFDYVEIHPEKLPEIKKFMEYFLPTTLKLLEAYKKLDNQPIEGRNISTSKKEIEDTIETINKAFENLLDDLFEDLAMDISTDISVLETIFAQEGLLEDEIRRNNKIEED